MAAERSRKGTKGRSRRPARKTRRTGNSGEKTTRRGDARKERVLHTRISEKLAADISRVAEDLRVPASNLVRNVLEDAFSVVESVTDNVGDLIESVLNEAERARERITQSVERTRRSVRGSMRIDENDETAPDSVSEKERPEFRNILGWQPMILNHSQCCSDCGVEIARGKQGLVGVAATGLTETFLCLPCMHTRT